MPADLETPKQGFWGLLLLWVVPGGILLLMVFILLRVLRAWKRRRQGITGRHQAPPQTEEIDLKLKVRAPGGDPAYVNPEVAGQSASED